MKQLGLLWFTDTHFVALGLSLFFLVFISHFLMVFRKSEKQKYEMISKIPLQDEVENEQ
ncbi:MAG: cbb3-type cytochrome c oxidase subunit 3 [Pseudobdellovibrionaceae bacterium]|jgi:cbb3-type cytochrome oxidase subunit 3